MDKNNEIRFDWKKEEIIELLNLSFFDVVKKAMDMHAKYRQPNKIQAAKLLSIKTGGCPEDCSYCSQSHKFKTGVKASKLLSIDEVKEGVKKAKNEGASRYCLGAAWRSPKDRDMDKLCEMIKAIKDEGLESCMTLGMIDESQSKTLADAGLDYYNHNIDTSKEFYNEIITTRTFEDRIETLNHARKAGLKLCTGGILGLGETLDDRASMLATLATINPHPESVPINALIPIKGTKLENNKKVTAIEIAKMIAVARIVLPTTSLRLSAGRDEMSDEGQVLCFLAGADSIFIGDVLLTASNPSEMHDKNLVESLGFELI